MGGRGAFLKKGGFKYQGWESVGTYRGIKILKKVKKKLGEKEPLPWFSNTPGTGYLKLNSDRTFNQYRQYKENREPEFDLDYDEHKHKLSLHLHYYINGQRSNNPIIIATPEKGILNKELYNKFKPLLKGVKL